MEVLAVSEIFNGFEICGEDVLVSDNVQVDDNDTECETLSFLTVVLLGVKEIGAEEFDGIKEGEGVALLEVGIVVLLAVLVLVDEFDDVALTDVLCDIELLKEIDALILLDGNTVSELVELKDVDGLIVLLAVVVLVDEFDDVALTDVLCDIELLKEIDALILLDGNTVSELVELTLVDTDGVSEIVPLMEIEALLLVDGSVVLLAVLVDEELSDAVGVLLRDLDELWLVDTDDVSDIVGVLLNDLDEVSLIDLEGESDGTELVDIVGVLLNDLDGVSEGTGDGEAGGVLLDDLLGESEGTSFDAEGEFELVLVKLLDLEGNAPDELGEEEGEIITFDWELLSDWNNGDEEEMVGVTLVIFGRRLVTPSILSCGLP